MSQPAIFKYEALVLDPQVSARSRLKQAAQAVPAFGMVSQYSDAGSALSRLKGQDKCDVIFIANRIGDEAIAKFIKDAKESEQGKECAFVMVMSGGDEGGSTVAANMLRGADGFLVEPFSVDSLLEITKIAYRVKQDFRQERQRAAMKVLLKQIMAQLDICSEFRAAGHEASVSVGKLREMCAPLKTFDEESKKFYIEAALELFEKAPPPDPNKRKKIYKGASKRAQMRAEQKANSQ